uniref:Transposase MuDR plant domain-containing protein n=1 Tax=Oryza punctata TaxID=4537 RepID=A0A0E0MEA6_ORYPU
MDKTCRSEFLGSFTFKWPTDANVTNFKDFMGDICEKYPWGSKETPLKNYAYLENPSPHYEHVGVNDEKQYSVGTNDSSPKSDDSSLESDDSIAKMDNVPEVEGGDDLSITDSDDEGEFSTHYKVDYITNNLAECFNN